MSMQGLPSTNFMFCSYLIVIDNKLCNFVFSSHHLDTQVCTLDNVHQVWQVPMLMPLMIRILPRLWPELTAQS